MIAAWPSVISLVPDARLLFVGDGPGLGAARVLAAASPVAASIEVRGHVAEQNIPALWRAAHLLAMPSRKEGFGIVYAEAMRCRLPVLASVHDAGQEINVHGKTGLNVNLDNEGELADTLISLLRSPERLQQFGEAGHLRWQTHFRPSCFNDRFLQIIAEFVRSTP